MKVTLEYRQLIIEEIGYIRSVLCSPVVFPFLNFNMFSIR